MVASTQTMHRFFVPPELVANLAPARGATTSLFQEPLGNVVAPLAGARSNLISLPKSLAHQVRDVLRLHAGEQLLLLDNSGDEVLATVATTSKTAVEVNLIERRPGKSEPTVRIILCQGLLKSARFEWILEKGTELGVSVFSPILCRRSISGLEDAGPTKIQRWQRIIQEAAEQSGRSRLPELLAIRPLIHALNDIPPHALAIMLWEEERVRTLRNVFNSPNRVGAGDVLGGVGTLASPRPDFTQPLSDGPLPIPPAVGTLASPQPDFTTSPSTLIHRPTAVVLFIGPEGGLTIEEVGLAQRQSVQVVTLGSRILRAETAALAAVANVMYELEQ